MLPRDTAPSAEILYGFAPVIASSSRLLILGSFPGVASLQQHAYYAHPQNQFWRLLSEICAVNLTQLSYPERLQCLLQHHIGIWDIYASCERQGSLHSAIRHGSYNRFDTLRQHYPQLQKLCFNGKTAAKVERYLQQLGYQTQTLPSSSPAYAALSFNAKLEIWREACQAALI